MQMKSSVVCDHPPTATTTFHCAISVSISEAQTAYRQR